MSYGIKHKSTVNCAKCNKPTTEYRPVVINNKPVWVCSNESECK